MLERQGISAEKTTGMPGRLYYLWPSQLVFELTYYEKKTTLPAPCSEFDSFRWIVDGFFGKRNNAG
ncbi:MAG: hypothetical protein D6714_07080 [Bacteroidetes bacterium]|nr:MAG: hypothetical protein D6714_07080 [Bacteroidota bacterium]